MSKNFAESIPSPSISNSPFDYLESSQVVSSFVFILCFNDFPLKSVISKPLEITYL